MKNLFCTALVLQLFAVTAAGQAVSELEAKRVALHFFNSRAPERISEMRCVNSSTTSREAATYFVFEPGRGEGFVIVSADKNTTPILAYSTENRLSLANMPPPLRHWLSHYDRQIREIRKSGYQARPEIKNEWARLSANTAPNLASKTVWHLLNTKWGQGTPYNAQCPANNLGVNAVTGCVATAMAQIMRYWEWPNSSSGWHWVEYEDEETEGSDVQGTFSGLIGGGQYTWNLMPNTSPSNTPQAQIAKLMRHAGLAVEMNYGTKESGAYSHDIPDAMEDYFDYQESQWIKRFWFDDDGWEKMLQNSIDASIPVIYSGYDVTVVFDEDNEPEEKKSGHTWVVDGYDDRRFHMNWGWDGNGDGFYYLGFLYPDPSAGWMFDLNHSAVFGIVPDGMNCPPTYLSTGLEYTSRTVHRWVSAESVVPTIADITFSAGDSITLHPGFVAMEGCTFMAMIAGCKSSQRDEPDESPETLNQEQPEKPLAPGKFSVAPNPFSGSTTVRYFLATEQQVSVQLFDVTGKCIATPLPTLLQAAGEHQIEIEAMGWPPGIYVVVLQMGERRESKRLVLL